MNCGLSCLLNLSLFLDFKCLFSSYTVGITRNKLKKRQFYSWKTRYAWIPQCYNKAFCQNALLILLCWTTRWIQRWVRLMPIVSLCPLPSRCHIKTSSKQPLSNSKQTQPEQTVCYWVGLMLLLNSFRGLLFIVFIISWTILLAYHFCDFFTKNAGIKLLWCSEVKQL